MERESYIQHSAFCLLNVQKLSKRCSFLWEVIKIIPTNQLLNTVMKGKTQPFSVRGTPVSHEILAKLHSIRYKFF